MESVMIGLGIVSAAALTFIGNALGDWIRKREHK